jgi:precorrin-6A/cobalt-precorrin-6A reductase
MRVLVLGGTSEARQLCEQLARRKDVAVTVSLAGRTLAPARQAVPVRIGGFGGASGLAEYLLAERVDLLIDATHPYAAIISAHAAEAARSTGVPLLALRRAAWQRSAFDRWIEVADVHEAVRVLGDTPRRVFLALGRNELAPFEESPQHFYLIRSVDPVSPPFALPQAHYITARGPFGEADERALLTAHRVDAVVAKNSGGEATYGKIAAARELCIDVVMLRRPALPQMDAVETVVDALAWVDHIGTTRAARGV